MQVRDNVRERRRERIARLVERQESKERLSTYPGVAYSDEPSEGMNIKPRDVSSPEDREENGLPPSESDSSRFEPKKEPFRQTGPSFEPDPELWWREREKRLKAGQVPGWEGLKGIPQTSVSGGGTKDRLNTGRFIRGIGIRLAVAIVAFAGFWGWMKLDLPGSSHARTWMVGSVTRDMDFRAIEAWYGDTFGGSPSFLPFGRSEPETREVTALLDPSVTTVPVDGTIVQNYLQNGKGVKMAAKGGSEVFAIYTGKVQQVSRDDAGGITILVQHQNRVLSVYGGLNTASVKPNDWVETGQTIGRLGTAADKQSEPILDFAVQLNDKIIDPADVVLFD